jgi:hypothetical protein
MKGIFSPRASFNNSCYLIENMVASDGVEPPTPAFSELVFPVFPTTLGLLWDCHCNTAMAVESTKQEIYRLVKPIPVVRRADNTRSLAIR